MRWFVSAGEVSGDIHASRLMEQLRKKDPAAEFMFLGGGEMARAAGHEPLIALDKLAYMGFSEVLRHLGDIRRNFSEVKKALDSWQPDAVVCVDYPGFNLRLASEARKRGIKVFYYISPKVWAWKSWRVKEMRRVITRLYSILPFEPEWFAARGLEAEYVGNPSVEEVDRRLEEAPSHEEFCRLHGLDPERKLLALVPGSRVGEIRCNLPVMAEVARSAGKGCEVVIAAAPGLPDELYERYGGVGMKRIAGDTLRLMQGAGRSGGAALVTSGTATLECALAGTPQVVCYRANGSRLSYNIMRRLIKVNHVSLPNLIAGRTVVPEMLLHECTPPLVEERLLPLLSDGSKRRAQLEGYEEMRRRLNPSLRSAATAARSMAAALREGAIR